MPSRAPVGSLGRWPRWRTGRARWARRGTRALHTYTHRGPLAGGSRATRDANTESPEDARRLTGSACRAPRLPYKSTKTLKWLRENMNLCLVKKVWVIELIGSWHTPESTSQVIEYVLSIEITQGSLGHGLMSNSCTCSVGLTPPAPHINTDIQLLMNYDVWG